MSEQPINIPAIQKELERHLLRLSGEERVEMSDDALEYSARVAIGQGLRLLDALEAERERVRQMEEALRELSLGAKSALNLWVPSDSVTHDELSRGLELAAATEPEAEEGEA